MKTLFIATALLAASFATALSVPPADEPNAHTLTVGFTNLSQRSGALYVGLINEESATSGGFFRKTRVMVTATDEPKVTFSNLPAGRYAVQVFQDLNNNMKLDYANEMPAEPFGFSNVTSPTGPFSFQQSAVALDAPKNLVITLTGN